MTETKSELSEGDLRVNRPTPWALYDQSGGLLLQQGQIIASEKQIDSLISLGAWYYEVPRITVYRPVKVDATRAVSSFHIIATLLTRLDKSFQLIESPEDGDQFVRSIMKLVIDIQTVCSDNASAVLGSIQVVTEAPAYLAHALHAALICEVAGRRMALTSLERFPLIAAALTKNAGMIAIQDILNAQPGTMTAQQKECVQLHPQSGAVMLEERGVSDTVWIRAVMEHHENIDGTGYPCGLHGDAISRNAKLLGIVDRYVAMTRPREYRPSLKPRAALKELYSQRGKSIDAPLTTLFIHAMGLFPPGSLVKLDQDVIAIVLEHLVASEKPRLALLTDENQEPREKPVLNVETDTSDIVGILNSSDYQSLLDGMGEIWPELAAI